MKYTETTDIYAPEIENDMVHHLHEINNKGKYDYWRGFAHATIISAIIVLFYTSWLVSHIK